MFGIYKTPGGMIVLWELMNGASIIALVVLLILYELSLNATGHWPKFARFLQIALIPLVLSFGVLFVMTVIEYLP